MKKIRFREYYGRGGNDILLDQQGHQYKCRGVMDYPNDHLFWLEGYPGDYFAYTLIFDPLPLNVKSFTYVVPEGEPFSAWGANWNGEVITDLRVQDLRQNQHLFEYQPRRIVKQPTNFAYSTNKFYSLVNKSTGAKLGVSFDYNIHASAYRESAPSPLSTKLRAAVLTWLAGKRRRALLCSVMTSTMTRSAIPTRNG